MLCAGGSPWQMLNIYKGVGLEKIEGRWRDFRVLWDNFAIAAQAVMDIGGFVALEWPNQCKYWSDPREEQFLTQREFEKSVFHGCAYDPVTRFNKPLGRPIKKPWRMASNDTRMLTHLNRKCVGDHEHAECRGEDCKASEEYTIAVVAAIHKGFQLLHVRGAL
jgi:hypothetical protein